MDPRRTLGIRRQLVEWLRTDRAPDFFESVQHADRTAELRRTLTGAHCYYVNEEMTEVARVAAKTMPDQLPLAEDFPSPSGFIMWDAPLTDTSVTEAFVEATPDSVGIRAHCRTVSWRLAQVDVADEAGRPSGKVPGAIFTFWGRYDDDVPVVVPTMPPMLPGQIAVLDFTLPLRQSVVEDNTDDRLTDFFVQFNMTVYATLVLMGQTVSTTERVRADRSEFRRGLRAEIPVSEVTVVMLRKRASSTDDDETSESRPVDWQRRWVVSGHWRQHWFPSLNDHRAIYIHEYVKGPEDKPLVMNEQVKALMR
jgi:hypothetical protein